MEWMKDKKADVSFKDPGRLLEKDSMFADDGVHLSDQGEQRQQTGGTAPLGMGGNEVVESCRVCMYKCSVYT